MEATTFENIKAVLESLKDSKIERKGFIILPIIDGFQFYELDEERLKKYLQLESMYRKIIKETES